MRSFRIRQDRDIKNIFVENNIRSYQLLTIFDAIKTRQGHDAIDEAGNYYQLKTTTTKDRFSTSHHLTLSIIQAYRETKYWIFGVCDSNSIIHAAREVYLVPTESLEPWFSKTENILLSTGKESINDPRIPLSTVKKIGFRVTQPKLDNMTTQEFITMIKTDHICKEIQKLIDKQVDERLDQMMTLLRHLDKQIRAVLSEISVQDIYSKIKTLTGLDVTSFITTEVAEVDGTTVSTVEKRLSDDEMEHRFRTFCKERVKITLGDENIFVSENTLTKHYQMWHLEKYGTPAQKKRAHITKKVFNDLGIKRTKKGRIVGIKLGNTTVTAV